MLFHQDMVGLQYLRCQAKPKIQTWIHIFRLGIYSTKFYCFCCFNHHINILFRYFGHGTGREFLQGDDIQRLDCRAVTLLMGCSSGKLQVSIFQTVEDKYFHTIGADKPTKAKEVFNCLVLL